MEMEKSREVQILQEIQNLCAFILKHTDKAPSYQNSNALKISSEIFFTDLNSNKSTSEKLKLVLDKISRITILELCDLDSRNPADKETYKPLPESIGYLKGLTKLGLASNNLTELPSRMRELSKLRELDLSRNPIEKLPLFLLDMSFKDKGIKIYDTRIGPTPEAFERLLHPANNVLFV